MEQKISEFLSTLIKHTLNIDAEIKVFKITQDDYTQYEIKVEIDEDMKGLLMGRRGRTLSALRCLLYGWASVNVDYPVNWYMSL